MSPSWERSDDSPLSGAGRSHVDLDAEWKEWIHLGRDHASAFDFSYSYCPAWCYPDANATNATNATNVTNSSTPEPTPAPSLSHTQSPTRFNEQNYSCWHDASQGVESSTFGVTEYDWLSIGASPRALWRLLSPQD